jgi:tRNA-dihydrouridine synthase A
MRDPEHRRLSTESAQPLDRRVCVAPMMDWTDRHCRFLHRLYAPHALLYTEMIVAAAIVRGDVRQLLDHDAGEHPVALQLGGCNPAELAKAARIGTSAGYAEINLNVGCPSDRVQNGSFGACLMLKPALVADCVRSMRDATHLPVTVKCRIGIDERDDYEFFRALTVILNGGLCDAPAIGAHLRAGVDGAMVGRGAYHRPVLLAELEQSLIDPGWAIPEPWQIVERMVPYAKACAQRGMRLHSITRHMHGVMAGREGARAWRRFLSEVAARPEAAAETLFSALPIIKQGIAA